MGQQTISIEDAMHAYEVLQLLNREIERMEAEAREHYKLADKLADLGTISMATAEREIGNTLMEQVIALKLITA